MCGICGFTGASDLELLKDMTKLLYHRGPDEDGFFISDDINMGMRRLSIIDVNTGKQPIHNEDKTIWSVWNGEIYNFQEIRKELINKGHVFYTDHSDSEIIVHLYEEYGCDFVNKINGMFAIAIWDKKEKKLLIMRDRIGVKPLFYSIINNEIIFGSEIKSILACKKYQKEPNFNSLYHYFTFKNIPSPMTAFKNIYCMSPGEMLIFKEGKITKRKYWNIDFSNSSNKNEILWKENIHEILSDAVKIRMTSDVPVGAFLSGGLDSSSVVAFMSKFSEKNIKTFSLGYKNSFHNKEEDILFARKIAKEFGTEHYEYTMSSSELIENIDQIITSFDQPFSGVVSTYFLSKLISKHVKVALSGDGSDELFGSYLTHRLAQPMENFSQMYDQYKDGIITKKQIQQLVPFERNIDFLEELYEYSEGDIGKWKYKTLLFNDKEKNNLLSSEFLNNISKENSYEMIQRHFSMGKAKDSLNKVLEMEWNTLLPDQVLAFSDALSMSNSLEVRSPFLDYRLVEYVSKIPGEYKIKNGIVKNILKEAVSDILPKELINRKKEGFMLPIHEWMKNEIKEVVIDTLSSDNLRKINMINTCYVNQLLSNFYKDESNSYNESSKIWNLVMFVKWWEMYF